jgi:tRNA (guanine37-N1)-methyltransferase
MAAAAAAPAIDRARFVRSMQVLALRVPSSLVEKTVVRLRSGEYLLDLPRQRVVVAEEAKAQERERSAAAREGRASHKLVLLHQGLAARQVAELPAAVRDAAEQGSAEVVPFELRIGYESLSPKEVLREILPAEIEVPVGYEQVGHIAHYNLRDEQMPFRHIIGQVTLDKNPTLRTVITKLGTIENEFRVFDMEVIAGERDFMTEVREHGCRFRFDFSKVYWNSRLQTEHQRVVDLLRPGEVVWDMFAGVGPFAIPAAKKGCRVFANDLNPDSSSALRDNAVLNHVTRQLTAFNLDARKFVRDMALRAERLEAPLPNHILMNLPAAAIDFLDALRGLYPPAMFARDGFVLPRVHCYCFSAADDFREDVLRRVVSVLGRPVPEADVRVVRDVAPGKMMYCCSFVLPREVATRRDGRPVDDDKHRRSRSPSPAAKRVKSSAP